MIQFLKLNKWQFVFFISLFVELMLHTKYKNFFGVFISPVIIFFSGLLLSISSFLLNKNYKEMYRSEKNSRNETSFFVALYLLAGIIMFFVLKHLITLYPISPAYSDIIPSLQKYVSRLLNGLYVYAPMVYDGWIVYPNYLTFQWFPFVFAEIMNIDYRLFAFLIYYLVLGIYFFIFKKLKTTIWLGSVQILLPFIYLYLFKDYSPEFFGHTVELLIAAYYLLLAFCLFSNRIVFFIVATSLCLFSRFSFLFWLPVFTLFIYNKFHLKGLVYFVLGVFLIGFLFYGLPFLREDPLIFFKGLKYYADAAVGEWHLKGFQNKGEYPFHLGRGIGFAIYFYEFYPGILEQKLAACRNVNIFLSVLVSVFFVIIYFINAKHYRNPLFILISLKVYFLFFYAFIHVPYLYLQIVPLSVSIALVFKTPLTIQRLGKSET